MNQQATMPAARAAVEAATAAVAGMQARFYLPVPKGRNLSDLIARITGALAPLPCSVYPMSTLAPRDLMLSFPGLTIVDQSKAFDAARALEAELQLPIVEPEIFHAVMAVDPGFPVEPGIEESAAKLMPGCWADPEPRIEQDKDWALKRMRVREAWAYAESMSRPSRGEGIVIAQPDTGVTGHPELKDVLSGGRFNLMDPDKPNDATDPMNYEGTRGHGTGTASVAVSGEFGVVLGSAPRARHMPIRAIDSVMRLSQARVAQAIDKAVDEGADVITMSLGGIYSFALQRAVNRAVEADVIVLAAAGNCVRFVVWPARLDDCIAVAGTNYDDAPWRGSCRGPDVDIAAPAQNVYRATAQDASAGQGQGTSFAVAMTAGVAACWLAYHGRANVIAAARSQRIPVQKLFRRMMRTTARAPQAAWDVFDMGPGIIDALGLLKADFEAGRDTEGPAVVDFKRPADRSIRDFAVEATIAPPQAEVDWIRHGPEVSLLVLRNCVREGSTALEGARGAAGVPSNALADALGSHLAGWLAPGPEPEPAPEAAPGAGLLPFPVSAPALRLPPRLQAPPAPPEAVQTRRRILAAREIARVHGGDSGGLEGMLRQESNLPADAQLPDPDSLLARIDQITLAMPEREMGDPQAFRQALETLHRHGDRALRKLVALDRGPAHGVNTDELGALEAIILADGSRPSFLLEDGLPPETHPFYGIWEQQIKDARVHIQKVARSVGRIQPSGGHASKFLGTGSLVDLDRQFVLTNYHVLDDARSVFGVPMTRSDSKIIIHDGLEIDFIGEVNGLERNRFKVIEALLPAGFGRGFGFLDAVLLRIETVGDESVLPEHAVPISSATTFAAGGMASLCTIGFPGRPAPAMSSGTVDWGFVTGTLFGNLFGFKRLAPGRFTDALATDTRDTREIVFGHDATTFGGASGSLILAQVEAGQDMPAFGLHFAGETGRSNHAIAAARAAAALRAIGVPLD